MKHKTQSHLSSTGYLDGVQQIMQASYITAILSGKDANLLGEPFIEVVKTVMTASILLWMAQLKRQGRPVAVLHTYLCFSWLLLLKIALHGS